LEEKSYDFLKDVKGAPKIMIIKNLDLRDLAEEEEPEEEEEEEEEE